MAREVVDALERVDADDDVGALVIRGATAVSVPAVAIFAQGPVGLCATAGARLHGAGLVMTVEGVPERAELALELGASTVLEAEGAVARIRELTGRRGVEVAIEALGRQETFGAALEATRLDGTVSSVGVYASSRSLDVPIGHGFYQRRIVTSLCPSGSERLRRLFALAEYGPTDLSQLFTHRLPALAHGRGVRAVRRPA